MTTLAKGVKAKPPRTARMWARWSHAGTTETAVLTAALVLAALGGVYLVVQTFRGLGQVPQPGDDRYHGMVIVGCGFAAFIAGRVTHLFRGGAAAQPWQKPRWGAAAVTRVALLLFFAAGVCLLGYEAIGLWTPNGKSPWGIHPITHYIRYAKEVAALPTGIVAVVVSFLVGHWLWPPSRSGPVGGET